MAASAVMEVEKPANGHAPGSSLRCPAAGPLRQLLMNYAAYATEDFLADESFQAFALGQDPVAEQFWRTWLAQHPAKQAEAAEAAALLHLLAANQPPPLPQHVRQAEAAKLWQAMQVPQRQPALWVSRRTRRWAGAVVAALGLLAAGTGLWQRATVAPTSAPAPAWISYATRAGEHREVRLPDDSRVTLNGNSVLKLAATWPPGHAREVWLTGEAFFRVQHTAPAQLTAVAAAPAAARFTVHAGPLEVAVLGTQFDVLNQPGRTNVVLQSGQVQLRYQRAGRTEELLLKPGELAEVWPAAPAALAAPLTKRAVNAPLYAAWMSGHLDLDNTPLAEIIALLEDTYGLHITLRTPALRQQKLTGSVPNHNLDVLLTTLAKSLDTNVHRTGNQVRFD